MPPARLFITGRLLVLLILLSALRLPAQSGWKPGSGAFVGWTTNGPAAYRMYISATQSIPGPALSYLPPPQTLPLELRRGMLMFRAAANTIVLSLTNRVFDHILPESLNWFVWTNFITRTNGKNCLVWSVRSRPSGWPKRPPVVQWNTNSLIWGMKGLTALSPCNEIAVNPGYAPITALTRRHGYTLGHDMRGDHTGVSFAGMKVWFLTTRNQLVQTTIKREIVRTGDVSRRDYTLFIFSSDLPPGIEPMRVIPAREVFAVPSCKYGYVSEWTSVIFQTEQLGYVSAGVPGFTLDTGVPGDSGSPNMLPMLNELVFCSGRTTTGPSPEMQTDMDTLSRLERLDPHKYQMQWVDLSAFPTYATQ